MIWGRKHCGVARMRCLNPVYAVVAALIVGVTAQVSFAQPVPADQKPGASGPQDKAGPSPSPADEKQAALRASYDAAFKATLDKPSDPAVLLKFAEVAVEFGDVEGAISALERLLLIDGDQPEVKLELGVLYYRLGSIETARAYLEEARNSDSASDEIRKRADTYLKEGAPH